MFLSKERPKYQRMLESELERVILCLKTQEPNTEGFERLLKRAEQIHTMMENEKPSKMNPETRATVAANLIGIILILKHEYVNVITSKALGFVIRTR